MVEQGFIVGFGKDYENACKIAAEHNFDYLELNMDCVYERQRVEPATIKQVAERYGVPLHVHLPYALDIGSPHESVRDGSCRELEQSIEVAADFGATKAIFHGSSQAHPAKWDREEIQPLIFESIRRIDSYARELGVDVCVENLKSKFFDASDFATLFDRTDALACLDTGHAHVTGQSMTRQADLLREWGERISHIHLNDTRIDDNDEHLPIGLGKLNFESIADAITETGWSGTATHELLSWDLEYAIHSKSMFDRLL